MSIVKRLGRHVWTHLFWYTFLLVQVAFVIWLVSGVSQAPSVPTHCYDANGNVDITRGTDCATAAGGDIGTAIGAGLVFGLWVGLDIVLGLGRVVYVLSRRRKPAASTSR